MKKPLIVYVSGAPGSGKTTLATLIAEQLHIQRMSIDYIQNGVWFGNRDHDRKETLFNVFVPLLEYMSRQGISFVADHVLQKGLSEAAIIDKLRPLATIVYVHTQTADPIGRYISKIKESTLQTVVERREHLLERAEFHRSNLEKTNAPLDLGVPTIVVKTDDGYEPAIDEVMNFINNAYNQAA
jgi:adenylate kinase family enzyme